MSINLVVNISWTEWINLDPLTRRALELDVENIVSERQKERTRMEREAEMQKAHANSQLSYMHSTSSTLKNIFNH